MHFHRARSSAHGLCATQRDVLVAETNAPPKPTMAQASRPGNALGDGPRRGHYTQRNRITLLRDADGDGVPRPECLIERPAFTVRQVLVGEDFYVADSDAIMKFPYHEGDTRITAPGREAGRPARRHHQSSLTKDLTAAPMDQSFTPPSAPTAMSARTASRPRPIARRCSRSIGPAASGACLPPAFAIRTGLRGRPQSGALWVTVNERDELGNDLVPDYMTSVKGRRLLWLALQLLRSACRRPRQSQRPDLVAKGDCAGLRARRPHRFARLTFNTGQSVSAEMAGGAFVGQHGSWNRKPRAGLKVIFVPFADGKPAGKPRDVLTGFLSDNGEAQGRRWRQDRQHAPAVADDVGNTVWRVTPSKSRCRGRLCHAILHCRAPSPACGTAVRETFRVVTSACSRDVFGNSWHARLEIANLII